MGLFQIGVSVLTALLIGALTQGTWRTYFLLSSSVLAVYWLQPALPLRSFDFWLPSLSLALTVFTWLIISTPDTRWSRQNLIGVSIILGVATLIELSRYFLPDPMLTATTPPQFIPYLLFIAFVTLSLSLLALLAPRFPRTPSFAIILILTILVILKSSTLSLQTSI